MAASTLTLSTPENSVTQVTEAYINGRLRGGAQ
jgi:hypothetical protein